MSDQEPLISVRAGWPAALVGLILAAATTVTIIVSSTVSVWLAGRLAIAGLVVFAAGIAFGSERMTGASALPMLAGAILGADPGLGLPWGRALIIGCIWYGALEAGWSSIEYRHGARTAAAVTRRRIQEVATIVMLAVVVGAGGIALGELAPTRTLLVRGSVIAAVLVALAMGLRQLRSTFPTADSTGGSTADG